LSRIPASIDAGFFYHAATSKAFEVADHAGNFL